MLYGATLSAAAAAALVIMLGRPRSLCMVASAALAAFVMPLAWNLILRDSGATGLLSHDLPFRPFPISWQDTGTGVFTLAGATLLMAFGTARNQSPPRAAALGAMVAIAALLVDVYAY
jgi:hypothetical protein